VRAGTRATRAWCADKPTGQSVSEDSPRGAWAFSSGSFEEPSHGSLLVFTARAAEVPALAAPPAPPPALSALCRTPGSAGDARHDGRALRQPDLPGPARPGRRPGRAGLLGKLP